MESINPMKEQLHEIFADLIQKEADRIQLPMDQPEVVAEEFYGVMEEALLQQAFEAVSAIQEARDSLPPFENPTGDTQTLAELAGACN